MATIPKIIHYCWFGKNKKSKLAKKCIKSWKKFGKGYRIIEWNETNYNISAAPLYVRQAYEARKWAYVTDYVRLQVVYENGGIYLDTDVEVIRPLDSLLNHHAYFGLEDGKYVATGLGFGAEKGATILTELMTDYRSIPFIQADGSYDLLPCPVRNTQVFSKYGLMPKNEIQVVENGVTVYPSDWFDPIDHKNFQILKTENTYSIHMYAGSWFRDEEKETLKRNRVHAIKHIPNRIFMLLLGKKRYLRIKEKLKGSSH